MFTNNMRIVFIIFSLVSIESYTMPYTKKPNWVKTNIYNSKKKTCNECPFAYKCNNTKVNNNYEKENIFHDEESIFLQEGELSILD